jgi:hypothetical protein
MTGAKGGDMRGIIPRSVEQMIEQVMLMRESGWEIVVTASMVKTNDLLATMITGAVTHLRIFDYLISMNVKFIIKTAFE